MLNRIKRMSWLVVVLATSAWGRGEFRLGGADGNSWQALVAEQTASYVLLDADGGIVEEVTLARWTKRSVGASTPRASIP